MNEIRIKATSQSLTINGVTWTTAPSTTDLCRALSADEPVDGEPIIIERKKDSIFRYFDPLGIGIIEKIPENRVRRISIHFQSLEQIQKNERNPRPKTGERATTQGFPGVVELNGKVLKAPLLLKHFPERGDLQFTHHIAIGTSISAMFHTRSGIIQRISFDFCSPISQG